MNILLFILVLSLLIFIHELGHFLFAKWANVRVDEFGFGYPPRALRLGTWRGTEITLNWIPFGGFVKLFDPAEDEQTNEEDKKFSLSAAPRYKQFLVLFGGILFNIILAWLLFSASYMIGVSSSTSVAPKNYTFDNTELIVSHVVPQKPAALAGLQSGDVILEYGNRSEIVIVEDEVLKDFADFVDASGRVEEEIYVVVQRNEALKSFEISPMFGVVPDRFGIGLGVDRIGELRLPFFESLAQGFVATGNITMSIVNGFGSLFTGKVPLDAVSGPVGIVDQVRQASDLGITYLIGFVALLSLNLAVLNAFPFPALDGGRIIILFIESIIGKRIKPTIVGWVNAVGFFILIGFMIFITVKDVIKLF